MKYGKFFITVMVLGLLTAPLLIGVELLGLFRFTENDLVSASYLFVPAVVFGLAGLLLNKRFKTNPEKLLALSLLYSLLGFFLLMLFYVNIWPSL